MLEQLASESQPPLATLHSLKSTQSPLTLFTKPTEQLLQKNDPAMFVQVRSLAQPPLAVAHSLISSQPYRPSLMNPEGQGTHAKEPAVLLQTFGWLL